MSVPYDETWVGFSTPRRWNVFSAIIRWISGSEVSHAWLVYYDQDFELDMVMEAHSSGFRLVPYAEFTKDNQVVAIARPKRSIQAGLKTLAHKLGVSYPFGKMLGVLVVRLGRWLKRKWYNPGHNAHGIFCSEAVLLALQSSGYPGAWDMQIDGITPQDLLTFFMDKDAPPLHYTL